MEPNQLWTWDNQRGRFIPVRPAGRTGNLPQQDGNRSGSQNQRGHSSKGQRGGGHRGTRRGGSHGINEGNPSGQHFGQLNSPLGMPPTGQTGIFPQQYGQNSQLGMPPTGQTRIFPQQFSQNSLFGMPQGVGSSVTSNLIFDQNEQKGNEMRKGSAKRNDHRQKKKQDGAVKTQDPSASRPQSSSGEKEGHRGNKLGGQNKRQGNVRRRGRGRGRKQSQSERREGNTDGACGGERASEDGSDCGSEEDENEEEYSDLKDTLTYSSNQQGTENERRNNNDVSTSNQAKDNTVTGVEDIKDLGLTTLKNRMKRYKSKLAALKKEANKSTNNDKALEKIALFGNVIEQIDVEIKSRSSNVDAQVPLEERPDRKLQNRPRRKSDNENDDRTAVAAAPHPAGNPAVSDTDDSASSSSNSEDEESLKQFLQQEGKGNRAVEVLLSKLKDLGDQIAELKINKSDVQEESESTRKSKPKSQEFKASTDSLRKEKTPRKKSTQDPGNQTVGAVASNDSKCREPTEPLGDQTAKLKIKKKKTPKKNSTQQPCNQTDREPTKPPEENEVFEYLIKTVEGPTSLKNKSVKNLFPKDFDIPSWFRSHEKRFILFENKEKTFQFVVPFYKEATFCLDYNGLRSDKKCENKDCTHAHICKDFVGGFCNQGPRCQFSHNFFDRANASLISKLDLGTFNNDQIRLIYSQRFPHVCSQYGSKNICYRPVCGYLHICKKSLSGECDEGSYCTLSHHFKTDQNTSVLKAYHLENWNESLIKILIFTHGSSVVNTGSTSHKDSSPLGSNESLPDKRPMSQNRLNKAADITGNLQKGQKGKPRSDDKKVYSRCSTSPSAEKRGNDNAGENESFIKEQISSINMEKGKPSRRKRKSLGERKQGEDRLTETMMPPSTSLDADIGGAKPKGPRPRDQSSNVGDRSSSVLETDAAQSNPICDRYLVDKCKTPGCKCHHIDSIKLPYIWQIKMLQSWLTLDKQQIIEAERAYCNREDNFKAKILYGGSNYIATFEFNKPDTSTAQLVTDVGSSNFTIQTSVRRLSTVSYTKGYKPSAEETFKTQWRWFYTNDFGNWFLLEPELLQFTLEQKFTRKCQDTYLFCRENYQFKYRIDFRSMKQINMETGKERNLLRRPLFVSAEDVESKRCPVKIVIPTGVDVLLPKAWVPWDLAHGFELVELKRNSAEFKKVEHAFFTTLPPQEFHIGYICRVQNMELWMSYDGQKKKMKISLERAGQTKEVDERNLFHGTDILDTVRGICTNSFDFRLCGKHGTLYGQGAYFAQNAKYSHSYTNSSSTTVDRYMFLAKVLVGEYTTGSPNYTRPPEKSGGTAHQLFDSCVDNIDNPSIFVVFDLKQCYPEYLICYKRLEEFPIEKATLFRSNTNATPSLVAQIQPIPLQYESIQPASSIHRSSSSEEKHTVSALSYPHYNPQPLSALSYPHYNPQPLSALSYPHYNPQPLQSSSSATGSFSDSVSSGAVSYSPPQSRSMSSDISSNQTINPGYGHVIDNFEAIVNMAKQSVRDRSTKQENCCIQ